MVRYISCYRNSLFTKKHASDIKILAAAQQAGSLVF